MRASLSAVTATCLISCLSACQWTGASTHHGVQGEGEFVIDQRELPPFDEVMLRGGFDVQVVIGKGSRLELETYPNLVPLFDAEVEDGVLSIGWKEAVSYDRRAELRLTCASLERLRVRGSATIDVAGLDDEGFAVEVSGSCRGTAAGRVDQLDVAISGSGALDFSSLQARQASVSISGSGKVRVDASEHLEVAISGSGEVSYQGAPRVSTAVDGSGTVRRSED